MTVILLILFIQRREDAMMAKIKDAEHAQTVAEMRRRIAELEIAVSV